MDKLEEISLPWRNDTCVRGLMNSDNAVEAPARIAGISLAIGQVGTICGNFEFYCLNYLLRLVNK